MKIKIIRIFIFSLLICFLLGSVRLSIAQTDKKKPTAPAPRIESPKIEKSESKKDDKESKKDDSELDLPDTVIWGESGTKSNGEKKTTQLGDRPKITPVPDIREYKLKKQYPDVLPSKIIPDEGTTGANSTKQLTIKYGFPNNGLFIDALFGSYIDRMTSYNIGLLHYGIMGDYEPNSHYTTDDVRLLVSYRLPRTFDLSSETIYYDKRYGLFATPEAQKGKWRRKYYNLEENLTYWQYLGHRTYFFGYGSVASGRLYTPFLAKKDFDIISLDLAGTLEWSPPRGTYTLFGRFGYNAYHISRMDFDKKIGYNDEILNIGGGIKFQLIKRMMSTLGLYYKGTNNTNVQDKHSIYPYAELTYTPWGDLSLFAKYAPTIEPLVVNDFLQSNRNMDLDYLKNPYIFFPDTLMIAPQDKPSHSEFGIRYRYYKQSDELRITSAFTDYRNFPIYVPVDAIIDDTLHIWNVAYTDVRLGRVQAQAIYYFGTKLSLTGKFIYERITYPGGKYEISYHPQIRIGSKLDWLNDFLGSMQLNFNYWGNRSTTTDEYLKAFSTLDFHYKRHFWTPGPTATNPLNWKTLYIVADIYNLTNTDYTLWNGYKMSPTMLMIGINMNW